MFNEAIPVMKRKTMALIKNNNNKKTRSKILTVNIPKIHKVGSGPTEKINLRIVDATNVLTPDSRGTVTTIAAETNITAQISPEKW